MDNSGLRLNNCIDRYWEVTCALAQRPALISKQALRCISRIATMGAPAKLYLCCPYRLNRLRFDLKHDTFHFAQSNSLRAFLFSRCLLCDELERLSDEKKKLQDEIDKFMKECKELRSQKDSYMDECNRLRLSINFSVSLKNHQLQNNGIVGLHSLPQTSYN